MGDDEQGEAGDGGDADAEVLLERVDDLLPEEVREQPDQSTPRGGTEDVPSEETREAHISPR